MDVPPVLPQVRRDSLRSRQLAQRRRHQRIRILRPTLLLTFFYRHLRPLIEQGYVYLAQPPLFRVDHGKETYWALDEADRDRIVAELPKNAKAEIMRFKGLGEMQPEELKRTTLDPATRRFLRVTIADGMETDRVLTELMGKDVEARFKFIMERSAQADLDI